MNSILNIIAFFMTLGYLCKKSNTNPNDEISDIGLNITTYVPKYGYPLESHTIQTDDGYILTVHRIPHGKSGSKNGEIRPPVLLMHGLLCSSIDWLNNGPNNSLGFLLVDQGYDVWLGNQRGNMWSRKHISLNPDVDKKNFFDFSFHEMGVYDLPAIIDYVLNHTKQDKLFYVGHSQGTTSFFIMASEKPEYNKKIRLMTSLAPVAYMNHSKSILVNWMSEHYFLLKTILDIAHIYELLPHSELTTKFGEIACIDGSPLQNACAIVFYIFGGYDPRELNKSRIPVYASNAPSGASAKQLYHYLQLTKTANFQQYDYGPLSNLKKYGKIKPPKYQISNITAPVALYYAKNDILSSAVDVERLAKELPNAVNKRLVAYEEFSHLDFQWGVNVKDLVYNEVIDMMSKY